MVPCGIGCLPVPPSRSNGRHAPRSRHRRPSVELLEERQLLAGNVVLAWNAILLDAIRTAGTAPPVAARDMAIVQSAVFGAVNAIERDYRPYHVEGGGPRGASLDAAVVAAADATLESLYPAQAAKFAEARRAALAAIPDGPSKDQGVRVGDSAAAQILAWRSDDGSDASVAYTPGTEPGQWRPTPPDDAPALLPQWPDVTPFAMSDGAQFRPAGFPALGSAEYAAALADVKSLGAADSKARTPDQTQIAWFWADGTGTATPPGHWNAIAAQVAEARGDTIEQDARLFALLDIALADAGIAAWDAKFADNCWRPITAIRLADADGNPLTVADPSWTPLLPTPPFPSYVSGHSAFSGAAAAVLTAAFGPDVHFTATSDALPGVTRSFDSFWQAAEEAGRSRVYGGIHFEFDNRDGLEVGGMLGRYVARDFLIPRKDKAPPAVVRDERPTAAANPSFVILVAPGPGPHSVEVPDGLPAALETTRRRPAPQRRPVG